MNLALLILAATLTSEVGVADASSAALDAPLDAQARSAQAFALPTAVTPAQGTVTTSFNLAHVFDPAATATLSYSPADRLMLTVGGLYWLEQGIGVGGQAKLQVARTAGGGLSAALVGGGGYLMLDGPSNRPLGYGGAVVSACLGDPCSVLLSAFGAGTWDGGPLGVGLWVGGNVVIESSSFVQLVGEGYYMRDLGFPMATLAIRITPGAWTLDLGAMVAPFLPLPYLSLGYTF